MLRSMYSAISGMKAQQTKLDVTANNITNVGTTGFKASKVNFSDALYQSSSKATAATNTLGGTNAKSVGLGAKVSSINKLMTNGNALSTGRTLDNDIDGEGYFIVTKGTVTAGLTVDNDGTHQVTATATGTVSERVYTRDGNFSLDADGNLLTSDGYRVMGYYASGTTNTGTTVVASGSLKADVATYDLDTLSPLAIPDSITVGSPAKAEAVSEFAIGSDGVITVTTSSGKYGLGQIAMATFKNPEGLEDLGKNYVQDSQNSGQPIISTSKSEVAANSNSTAYGSIKSGYLESSNVDLTEQFTDMISATRSFQAASKMISNGDEILQTITGLIR